jgi:hypothetical protein
MRKKNVQVAAIVSVFLLAAAALSTPGRTTITRLLSSLSSRTPRPEPIASAASDGPDLEARARLRHGWSAAVDNSVVQGAVTFYNRDGSTTGRTEAAIYRRYPDRLRVVLTRGASAEVLGFDQTNAWSSSGAPNERQSRDIRQWLRICPERLFTTRSGGANYREAGGRREDFRPGRPWQGPGRINPPLELEQVQMEDILGPPPDSTRPGDRRFVIYYINRQNYTIESARWLEPDDPRRRAEDRQAATMDVRVDFGDWRTVGGVLWPFDIVHWQGGRVDYRVVVNQVLMNQPLDDTIFQRP